MCSECVQSVFRVCSECAQSVLRVCSECAQIVFRVCSECVQSVFNMKSFHLLAHLVCQFLAFFSSRARRVFPAFNLHSVDLWSNLLVGDMKYRLTKYLPIFFLRCPPIFAKLRRVPSKYWPSKCYKSLAFVDICKIACDQSDGP